MVFRPACNNIDLIVSHRSFRFFLLVFFLYFLDYNKVDFLKNDKGRDISKESHLNLRAKFSLYLMASIVSPSIGGVHKLQFILILFVKVLGGTRTENMS